jgi:hypothetical protein
VPFPYQAFDAVGENGGFAGASTGDHQHRTEYVLDGLALAVVWSK